MVPLVARLSDFFWLVSGLTHCGLLVMTRHIVPFDTVSVEIIEDAQTGLECVIMRYITWDNNFAFKANTAYKP